MISYLRLLIIIEKKRIDRAKLQREREEAEEGGEAEDEEGEEQN